MATASVTVAPGSLPQPAPNLRPRLSPTAQRSQPCTAPDATWQGSLLGSTRPRIQDLTRLERTELDAESWIDLGRDIVHGSDELFAALHERLPWRHGRRPMYDRMVDVPRLCAAASLDDPDLPDTVRELGASLSAHYATAFDHIGANLYRSGDDSVAWHGDRVGRRVRRPIIAIVSLGGSRMFRLRPSGGGRGHSIPLHSGDVLVMGGACQHRWEHAVPKVRRAQPRISLTYRHDGEPGTYGPAGGVSV